MAFHCSGACFGLDVLVDNKWIHLLTPNLNKSLEKYIPKSIIEDSDC